MTDLPVSLGLLSAVLLASLVGSLHCAAMCGPFVMVYSAGTEGRGRGLLRSHLAYHGGRVLTYVGLGAVAGALGSTVDWAFEAIGLVRVAAFVSGALVILWGLGAIAPIFRGHSPLSTPLRQALVKLGTKPRIVRASTLGVLTPLLPCGWLYAFVLTAGGTGSALGGGLVMLAFFVGTVPALLGVGLLSGGIAAWLRPRMPAVTAVALVTVGLFAVVSRALLPLPATAAAHEGSTSSSSGHVEVPGAEHQCH